MPPLSNNNITPPKAGNHPEHPPSSSMGSPYDGNNPSTRLNVSPVTPDSSFSSIERVSFGLDQEVFAKALRDLEIENEKLTAEAERYKKERDEARQDLAKISNQAQRATSSFESKSSPALSLALTARSENSPSVQSVQSVPTSHRRNVSLASASTNDSPVQRHINMILNNSNPMTLAGLPNVHNIWQAPLSIDRTPLEVVLPRFFERVNEWVQKYAIARIFVVANDYETRALMYQLQQLVQEQSVESCLTNTARPSLISALVNREFECLLVDKFLEKFQSQFETELYKLNSKLDGNVGGRARHEILVERAGVMHAIIRSQSCAAWLLNDVEGVARLIINLVKPLISTHDRRNAADDLLLLAKDLQKISTRMAAMPSEFTISFGRPGDRWEPNIMIQCDEGMDGHPHLRMQNGNMYKVMTSVSPSITEREYSRGYVTTKELHKKHVLLKPSPNVPQFHLPTGVIGSPHRSVGR